MEHNQIETSINIKQILNYTLKYWYVYLFSILFCLIISYFITKNTATVYQANANLLIKDPNQGYSYLMQGFGMNPGKDNLETEKMLLKSYTTVYKAVKALDIEISYYTEGFFFDTELYPECPFIVRFDSVSQQTANIKFELQVLSPDSFLLHVPETIINTYSFINEEFNAEFDTIFINKKFAFEEQIKSKIYNCRIEKNKKSSHNKYTLEVGKKYFFVFNDLASLVTRLQNSINVYQTNSQSLVVNVALRGRNLRKTIDALNALTKAYSYRSMDKKNKITSNTIHFINSQLENITDSLITSQSSLLEFRNTNEITDLPYQTKQSIERLNKFSSEKLMLQSKIKYYKQLNDYVEKNKNNDKLIAPSFLGIDDPFLTTSILELKELNAEKQKLLYSSNEKNPYIETLSSQITVLQNTILENIESNLSRLEISLVDVDTRISEINIELRKLPEKEIELIGFERQFQLNDDIFVYLLRQRAEALIAHATYLPENEIIDLANIATSEIVSPNLKKNTIIALIIGLLIPLIFIVLKTIINTKVESREDIISLTELPVLCQINTNATNNPTVVLSSPDDLVSESFRRLKTKLRYYIRSNNPACILISSSISGEGKTFCSINLASLFAISGKTTVLLGFDLRKPGIYKDFNLTNNNGISNFLINKASLEQIIQKTINKNLDIITAGPIPPNPAELIASEKTRELIEELKLRYEYIIIDTPPIGLVADAYLLMEFTHVNLLLARAKYTPVAVITSTLTDISVQNTSNFAIVLNDVKKSHESYYKEYV